VTVNATSFPSGDTAGADSVVTLYQSAGVKARRDGAAVVAGCAVAVAGRACAASATGNPASETIANVSERMDVCFTVAPRSGDSLAVPGM